MAMFMPVVKKNYNIYGDQNRNRNPSETAVDGRKISSASSASTGGSRRRVRSEGPSLSTSPRSSIPMEAGNGNGVIIQRIPIPRNNSASATASPVRLSSQARSVPNGSGSFFMRRARGSAPALGVQIGPSPLLRQSSMPEGPKNTSVPIPKSPSHSTGSCDSGDSSSSSNSEHGFHIKLLRRIRKSFRMKEPAPAAS